MPTPIIPTSTKRPGVYIQVTLGVGATSAADAAVKILILGNMLTGGSATVEERVLVTSREQARALFLGGSELFLMTRAVFDVFPSATLYAIPIAESAGAQAAGSLAFTGTATAPGTVFVTVLGHQIEVAVATGDTATVIGDAVEAAIADMTDWPVTAVNTTGTVAVTAKQAGPRGDHITLSGSTDAPGAALVVTGVTGGATSDDPQNALDAVAAERHHYLVAPYMDATGLADFETHCATYAGITEGKRQRWIAGSTDTLANTTTLATGRNDARGQIVHLYNGQYTPAMMAAAQAALRAMGEGARASHNFNGETLANVPPPASVADYPDGNAIASALNNGITPLEVTQGDVRVVRSITTRSQDASSNPSYSVMDSHKVVVPDFIADDLAVGYVAEFPDMLASADVEDPQELPDGVLTPAVVKDWIYSRLIAHEQNALLVNVAANEPELDVVLLDSPAGCFQASIPADVIEWANMFAADVRQIG